MLSVNSVTKLLTKERRYDDRGSCQKEERHEILNGIIGYPLSLLSKGENV